MHVRRRPTPSTHQAVCIVVSLCVFKALAIYRRGASVRALRHGGYGRSMLLSLLSTRWILTKPDADFEMTPSQLTSSSTPEHQYSGTRPEDRLHGHWGLSIFLCTPIADLPTVPYFVAFEYSPHPDICSETAIGRERHPPNTILLDRLK
jgi:hypothetical protein